MIFLSVQPACTRGAGAQGRGDFVLRGGGAWHFLSTGTFSLFDFVYISFPFISFMFFHLVSFPDIFLKELEPKSNRKIL